MHIQRAIAALIFHRILFEVWKGKFVPNDAVGKTETDVGKEILLLSLAAFASAVAVRMCDPMLPALARSFDTSTARAAMVITTTSVTYGICQLLFGPLSDSLGKFRIVAWACLASTVGALACAVSTSLEILSLARALTGATTSALIPLSMAWVGDTVCLDRRQPVLARLMSGQIVGLVSGQAVGGLFADTLGWRWAFVLLALIYCTVGLLLLRALKRMPKENGPREASANDKSIHERIGLIFGSTKARAILVIVFVEAMAMFGALAFIPTYLHERFGISLFQAGSVVATIGLGGLLYTSMARRWVQALGTARLALLGGTLLGLAFFILALAPGWGWAIVACILAGLGFYQLHNTLQTQATQMAPTARGMAVSIFASCFYLAQAAGVSLGSVLLEQHGAPWLFASAGMILLLVGWVFSRRLHALAGENLPPVKKN